MTTNEIKEVQFKDNKYIITRFGARKGQKIMLKLMPLLAPAIGEMATKPVKGKKSSNAGDSEMKAIQAIFANVSEETDELINELMEVVSLKAEKGPLPVLQIYDVHFSCNYSAIFFLIFQVIEHNGFLDLVDDLI